MRSGFLRKEWARIVLHDQVAIPSKWGLVSYGLFKKYINVIFKNVAIPSKWGLVSYTDFEGKVSNVNLRSQSLLNEVWFPTPFGKTKKPGTDRVAIPSKWGLVSYVIKALKAAGRAESQSLLNEVWFPTKISPYCHLWGSWVAIPSKWGLVSYWMTYCLTWGLERKSQSLLNEVWFPTPRCFFPVWFQ